MPEATFLYTNFYNVNIPRQLLIDMYYVHTVHEVTLNDGLLNRNVINCYNEGVKSTNSLTRPN